MIKATFDNPPVGSVHISIIFDNARFDRVASYVPNDAIGDLAEQFPNS